MGRKVNTIHKNFLEDLQARMRDRYTNNYANYTESDKAHARMAGIELPEPVAPVIPERKGSTVSAPAKSMDAFEAEYEAFVAGLKAKKEKEQQENKIEEVTDVPETNVETTQTTEETPVVENKPKKTRKKKEVAVTVQEEPVIEESTPVVEEKVEDLPEFELN
ncbi:MAG: hypothetical protein J6T10_17720 [Methanobrevibacter sp.]|nr:hypothetical protein [Methanobrevibacter sp.]